MKFVKTYESYFKDVESVPSAPFEMSEGYEEKYISIVRFLKKEFNYLDDLFKEVTGHGISPRIREGSTGNFYSLGDLSKLALDLVDNGVDGRWYVEFLVVSNGINHHNSKGEFTPHIIIENASDIKMDIKVRYDFYLEYESDADEIELPDSIKSDGLTKDNLKENFEKAMKYAESL